MESPLYVSVVTFMLCFSCSQSLLCRLETFSSNLMNVVSNLRVIEILVVVVRYYITTDVSKL